MSREWVIEAKADPSDPKGAAVHLVLKEAATGKVIQVTPVCRSLQDFTREINAMKAELDAVLEQARSKLDAARGMGAAGGEAAPDEVWKKMGLMATEGEMFEYFNSFGDSARQRIAEYILTHANMFKGRGPVFSERYDHSSNKLE